MSLFFRILNVAPLSRALKQAKSIKAVRLGFDSPTTLCTECLTQNCTHAFTGALKGYAIKRECHGRQETTVEGPGGARRRTRSVQVSTTCICYLFRVLNATATQAEDCLVSCAPQICFTCATNIVSTLSRAALTVYRISRNKPNSPASRSTSPSLCEL